MDSGKRTDSVLGGQLLIEYDNDRIILRRNGFNKLLIGPDSTNSIAFKVAKDGFDADTAPDSDLIFNSSQDVFKIVDQNTDSTYTYTIGPGTSGVWTNWLNQSVKAIPHGLDFVPSILAYAPVPGTSQYILLPTTFQAIVGSGGVGAQFNRISINVDATNVYLFDTTLLYGTIDGGTSTGGGVSIKYYLLQETAT